LLGCTGGGMYLLLLLLVFGGSGFLMDDDVGFGVGVGLGPEPSSHLPPIHVMMYVWRGTRPWWLAGAYVVSACAY